jgi:hypothetical protein
VCDPTGISETALVEIAIGTMVATTAVTAVAAHQQAMKQQGAINAQADARATQVAAAAGQQESVAAMEARQARSQSVVAAGESGINLGSNSFMASLQTTTMNQSNNDGLIMENEKNQQNSDTAQTQSLMNTEATSPTFLGGALNTALSGAGAYMSTATAYRAGAKSGASPTIST